MPTPQQPPGPATDAQGRVVIDPTANVRFEVDSAVKRLDDLRETESRHVHEILDIRAAHAKELSDVRDANTKDSQRREAQRLDDIRSVDVGAVAAAATAAEVRASALAAQVAVSADTVRTTLDAKVNPILEAIGGLQRAQYETAGGKAQVVDNRETSGNRALWIGLAVAAFVGLNGAVLTALGIVITLLIRK